MKSLADLRNIREQAKKKLSLRDSGFRYKVVVGMGTSGIASGAREVMRAFLDEVSTRDLTDIVVTQTGEKGLSSQEPVVDVIDEKGTAITYGNVTPEIAKAIVESHIIGNQPVDEYVISRG